MPSETSSVTVLPISVAPASNKRCTAHAWRVGTGCCRAQSGLPPPVGCPATSKRSLAANVRPVSGPRRSEEHTSELQSPCNLVCRIIRSEEHTSELQSPCNLVCRLLLEKKKKY